MSKKMTKLFSKRSDLETLKLEAREEITANVIGALTV